MIARGFLGLAIGSAVLLLGALAMATAIDDRPQERSIGRPVCADGSILTFTTDCHRPG